MRPARALPGLAGNEGRVVLENFWLLGLMAVFGRLSGLSGLSDLSYLSDLIELSGLSCLSDLSGLSLWPSLQVAGCIVSYPHLSAAIM